MERQDNPFRPQTQNKSSSLRAALGYPFRKAAESFFCLPYFAEIVDRVCENTPEAHHVDGVLQEMNISYKVRHGDLSRIPLNGPTIIVANHPFGGPEAFVLASMLRSLRLDVKIITNYMLKKVPQTEQYCIYVDPFETKQAAKRNLPAIRQSIRWVKNGGMLGVFPSGTVSHLHLKDRCIKDPKWFPSVATIVRKTQATVVPVFFHGRNSSIFQAAGLAHPFLRTMLLPREFYNKRNSELELTIGRPIPFEKLARFEDDDDIVEYLRLRTYILGNIDIAAASKAKISRRVKQQSLKLAPLAPPVQKTLLASEVAALPEEQLLFSRHNFEVRYASAAQAPHLLQEIGRLRELTFRGVSEGTGKALDVDTFDNFYTHLFVWNRDTQEVVGAYRIARTDVVLRNHGKRGLYTSTLFYYKSSLVKQLGPALELGRSFVRPEYQKDFAPLLLLWRGIGRFVAQNPSYKILLGPVSISNEYDSISRDLIVAFLRFHKFVPDLSSEVKPRNPHRTKPAAYVGPKFGRVVVDLQDVTELLEEIEATHREVPVLLRQYLKLNAKLLGFNVDPKFGDVLDGLIYVDLTEVPQRILDYYLGPDGAAKFLACHNKHPADNRAE